MHCQQSTLKTDEVSILHFFTVRGKLSSIGDSYQWILGAFQTKNCLLTASLKNFFSQSREIRDWSRKRSIWFPFCIEWSSQVALESPARSSHMQSDQRPFKRRVLHLNSFTPFTLNNDVLIAMRRNFLCCAFPSPVYFRLYRAFFFFRCCSTFKTKINNRNASKNTFSMSSE